MKLTKEQIIEAAMQLSLRDRILIVLELNETLDPRPLGEEEVDALERRVVAIDSGKVT